MQSLSTRPDDSALWIRAAGGESMAQEVLWEHLARVAKHDRGLAALPANDRDDMLQEAFRSLIESELATEIRDLDAFVRHRLHGARSTAWRKHKPTPVGLGTPDWTGPAPAVVGGASERAMEHEELLEQVDACCDGLKPIERRMVEMRIHDELPSRTIASCLGIPSSKLRVTLFRALRKLRQCLEAKGVSL